MTKYTTVPLFPQHDANVVYGIAYSVVRYYYLFSARLRVEGIENVPLQGGAVIVCNHTKGNDYFALGVAYPRSPVFMIKQEAFEWSPILDWILRMGGAFPVARGSGDMDALRTSVRVVQAGNPLCMFPEGHRSEDGKLQRGHTGAARIALESAAPVVPCVVINAEAGWNNFPRFWNRVEVLVRIGKPFYLEGKSGTDRRAVAAGHRKIMTTLASMLPEEMRGVWGDDSAAAGRPGAERRAASLAGGDAGDVKGLAEGSSASEA